jgi:hypothetical protein
VTSSFFDLRSKVLCREATTPAAGAAWSHFRYAKVRRDSRATSSLFALRSKVWYSNPVGFRIILENTGVKWYHSVLGPSETLRVAQSKLVLQRKTLGLLCKTKTELLPAFLERKRKASKSCRYAVTANFAILRSKVRGGSAIPCSSRRKRPTGLRMLARRAQQQHFVWLSILVGSEAPTWARRALPTGGRFAPEGLVGSEAPTWGRRPLPTGGRFAPEGLESLPRRGQSEAPTWALRALEPRRRPSEHEEDQGRAKLGRLEGPSVLSLLSKPTGLRPVCGNNTGGRRGPLSKRSKQQGLASKTKYGLNKICLNQRCCFATSFGCYANFCVAKVDQRLRQPFTAWGFVRNTIDCRTEVFGCRRQPIRGQSERHTSLGPQGLGNIVTKARYKTIRPLLNLSRDNLATLCKDLRLPVYPDKSNKAVQYSRNRLREQILPAVKLFLNPKIDDALFKLAELLTQDFSVVSHLVNTGRSQK